MPPSIRDVTQDIPVYASTRADTYRVHDPTRFGYISQGLVAIRVPRLHPNHPANINEILRICARTSGEHVCSPHIVDVRRNGEIVRGAVSPWFRNGNVLQYLLQNPNADRLALAKELARIISDIHSTQHVIGNLHPNNVMIGADGKVVLMDYGMHTFVDRVPIPDIGVPVPESWPYKPAEELQLFNGDAVLNRTQPMDVYAFATTVHAMYTGAPPVSMAWYPWLARVIKKGHGHLHRPPGMDQTLWDVLRLCLEMHPANRLHMADVVRRLRA